MPDRSIGVAPPGELIENRRRAARGDALAVSPTPTLARKDTQ
ncbi:MAG: hypothetical protein Q8S20_17505 [Sulfuritalea sp.]|nr:hypothetical protein [Sulfuritalea sp.]